jgi:hypothetical protein
MRFTDTVLSRNVPLLRSSWYRERRAESKLKVTTGTPKTETFSSQQPRIRLSVLGSQQMVNA